MLNTTGSVCQGFMGVEGGGEPTFGAFGRNFPGSKYEISMPVFQTVINLTNKGCYNYGFYTAMQTLERRQLLPRHGFHTTHPHSTTCLHYLSLQKIS